MRRGAFRQKGRQVLRGLERLLNPRLRFARALPQEPVSRLFGFDRGTPIDRYYIERFLQEQSGHLTGTVVEVAEDRYASRLGRQVDRVEILHVQPAEGVTLVGDLTRPETLPEGRADCFVCTQTFNFIYDFRAAAKGAHRLLKPGGRLLATVAGLSQISRYDMQRWGDFWRFTDASIKKVFEEVFEEGRVEVVSYGNVYAAASLLYGLSLEDLADRSRLDALDPDYQMILGIVAQK